MNADEVCHMIDTISIGKSWAMLTQDPDVDGALLGMYTTMNEVLFDQGAGHRVKVTDTRKAREIAGLLVAWANFKEAKL